MGSKIVINDAAVRVLIETSVNRGVARAAGKVRDGAKMEITAAGRINTGALRNSVTSREIKRGGANKVWYEVAARMPYAKAQHEGVKGPIYPRRAKVLRFKPKGSSTFVFARKVKGFDGVPYLARPLSRLTLQDYLGGG